MLTRQKEHMTNVRLGKTENSALAENANKLNHNILWDNTRILATENCWNKRRWTEALLIANRCNILFNRDCGRTIPPNYMPLISRIN